MLLLQDAWQSVTQAQAVSNIELEKALGEGHISTVPMKHGTVDGAIVWAA